MGIDEEITGQCLDDLLDYSIVLGNFYSSRRGLENSCRDLNYKARSSRRIKPRAIPASQERRKKERVAKTMLLRTKKRRKTPQRTLKEKKEMETYM